MTPGALTFALALGAGVLVAALAGPALLRRAAPALVRVPRLAIGVFAGSIGVWVLTVLAVGPALAWFGAGPALLPGRAAEVCQRCLAAANPFAAAATDTSVPTVLLVLVPAALAGALAAVVVREVLRGRARGRAAASVLLAGSRPAVVHGVEVSVVDAERPFALTFPHRQGGVVVSSAALDVLDDDELAAVLAHEDAHLRQRHHAVVAVVEGLAASLRWVPLVRAAADALPHYLEIAADAQARRVAGTPALVSALVTLGERSAVPLPGAADAVALHAAGPERIRQLVQPVAGPTGALPALAVGAYLLAMGALAVAVHMPYVSATLSGCAV